MSKSETTKNFDMEEIAALCEAAMEHTRIQLAQYSTEELLKMMMEGKNPLLGDKP